MGINLGKLIYFEPFKFSLRLNNAQTTKQTCLKVKFINREQPKNIEKEKKKEGRKRKIENSWPRGQLLRVCLFKFVVMGQHECCQAKVHELVPRQKRKLASDGQGFGEARQLGKDLTMRYGLRVTVEHVKGIKARDSGAKARQNKSGQRWAK